MTKEEQIREQIACLGCPFEADCDSLPALHGKPKHHSCEGRLKLADQILSIEVYKGYTIRDLIEKGVMMAEEQRLPNPVKDIHIWRDYTPSMAYEEALQDMLNPDSQGMKFVRVSPRDNKGGRE